MRFVRTAIIAASASLALAGAALAAQDAGQEKGGTMLVALPDGTVQHIDYPGTAAPRLVLVPVAAPADLFDAAFGAASPFAEMDRISAMMEAQSRAMFRQAAAMQARMPTDSGKGVVMTNAQGQPVGVMHYSVVSSTTSADGCTRTVSYSSDGANAAGEPRMIRTSSGSCGSADPAIGKPAAPPSPVTPTRAAPAARPAPKIIPVSAPAPTVPFTPSRT